MRILRNLHRRVLNYRINFSIRFQLLISYQFSDEKRFRCRSNSIMSLAQTFITFVTANVLRFVAEELPRCTSTIWARSTHSRKVHLFAIPCDSADRARARASIANVAGPRRLSSLWNKGPRKAWTVVEWVDSFFFLSRRKSEDRLAFSPPRLRFSLARPALHRGARIPF